jgi:hypothetical protein
MFGGVAASTRTRNRSNILRRQYDRMIDATVKMAPIARSSIGRNPKVRRSRSAAAAEADALLDWCKEPVKTDGTSGLGRRGLRPHLKA